MMKKTIFKLMPVVGLCAAMSLASCSDDKGNYTYSDANIITQNARDHSGSDVRPRQCRVCRPEAGSNIVYRR